MSKANVSVNITVHGLTLDDHPGIWRCQCGFAYLHQQDGEPDFVRWAVPARVRFQHRRHLREVSPASSAVGSDR